MDFALGGNNVGVVKDAIQRLFFDADRVAIAVSYIQISGAELLLPLLASADARVRILCTDQLGITDPAAVRLLISKGYEVKAYASNQTYHPKVYISTTDADETFFVMGSANLSRAALLSSVEAAVFGRDNDGTLLAWFDDMFDNVEKSVPFDDARLAALEEARAARLKSNLIYRRQIGTIDGQKSDKEAAAAEVIETAFSSLHADPLPLNIDKAGNTVRNLGLICSLLAEPGPLEGKHRSDMKQLGFVDADGNRTPLGDAARLEESLEGVARQWSLWLKSQSEDQLRAINPTETLIRARQIFNSFWSLPEEVTKFFLDNSTDPGENRTKLQAVELLANSGRNWPEISLQDIETLAGILGAHSNLQPSASAAIKGYLQNKGTRGWAQPDRAVVLSAWRDVQ